MYCTYKLTIASMKMFVRNNAALFFSMFVPLMIMVIFGLMDFDKQDPLKIGLVVHKAGMVTPEMLSQAKENKAVTIEQGTLEEELKKLEKGKCNAVVELPEDLPKGKVAVYVNGSKPIEAAMAQAMVQQAIAEMMKPAPATSSAGTATEGRGFFGTLASGIGSVMAPPTIEVEMKKVGAKSERYIEFLLPGIVAMAVMQMSVFSVAFAFAQEREKGVLKRLLATPVKPSQIVTANIVTRLMMSLAQSAILIVLGLVLFHVKVQGAYWLLGLCVLIGALMFLGLGFTIAGMARTIDTVPMLANLVVFPQMFLGNVFFSAASMPAWLQPIASNLPLAHFVQALRQVMVEGAGLRQIQLPLLALTAWTVGLVTLSIFTFRLQEREG